MILRNRVISYDTWIHRIVETGVRPLIGTRTTPNHLTTLRLLTGLSAAGLYAIGEAPWLIVASGLFVLSLILDRADGTERNE